ncbi:MAG: hypothetical protein KG003_07350 [Bacteroidetes bacterium]|nr:hypothetical protein [Bacteroidota bacterium]
MSRKTGKSSMIQFIDFELKLLLDYIEYVEDYFSLKGKEIGKNFEELELIPNDDPIRQSIEDYHQSYFDVLQDDLIDENFYNEEFTQRFRYSLIIQMQSFFEKYLTRISDHFKTKNTSIKTRSGNYIEKLQQVINEPDISICSNFEFMIHFTELRNCIVHNEGIICSDSKYLKRLGSIKHLEKTGIIHLKETQGSKRICYEIDIKDKSFLVESVNKIAYFIHELDALLQPHY